MRNISRKTKDVKAFNKIFLVCLLLIFSLGLLIRLIGTSPGYPPSHPDEPVINGTAFQMATEKQSNPFKFESYRFQYPGLMVYLHEYLYSNLFIPFSTLLNLVALLPSLDVYDSLFWGRYITAIIGFLAVVVIYLLGKELFNKYIGLIAALFLAVNFRHVLSSHLSLIDAPNSTFALLSLYLSLSLWKNPTRKNYLLAGLGVGFSFGTKLYFFSIFPFLLAHLLICLKNQNWKKIYGSFLCFDFISSLLLIGLSFVFFNPFLFLYPENLFRAIDQHTLNNLRYGMGSNVLIVAPIKYLYEIGFGKEFTWLFLIGFIIALFNKKYWIKILFILPFLIPPSWMLLYYSHGGEYVRNFTSIVPFVLLFSAFGLFSLIAFFFRRFIKSEILFLLLLIIISLTLSVSQLKYSLFFDYWLTKDWNYKCMQAWVQKNVKREEIIAKTGSVPLLEAEKYSVVPYTNNWLHNIGAYTFPELQEAGINYVILNFDVIQGDFNWWLSSKLWDMPIDKFDNSFAGLVVKELSRYEIKSFYKPWPSIDNNYSVIKIPEKIEYSKTQLIYNNYPKIKIKKVVVDGFNQRAYLISDYIKVEPSTKYLVKAILSSQRYIAKKQRDGYLRADFYETKSEKFKRGKIAAVSTRFWSEPEGNEVWLAQVAPENTHWLRVSFQAEDYTSDFQIKKLEVFEIKDKPFLEEIKAANKTEVDNSIIYPKAIL